MSRHAAPNGYIGIGNRNPNGYWRPKYVPKYAGGYDLIKSADRARLEAKWSLFQAQRRGECRPDLAQRERNVEYYDVAIPRWKAARAETEVQRARMLKAADACVDATNDALNTIRGN